MNAETIKLFGILSNAKMSFYSINITNITTIAKIKVKPLTLKKLISNKKIKIEYTTLYCVYILLNLVSEI